MSPKSVDQLNLGSETFEGVTSDQLPEQFGQRPDPPPVGDYAFELPKDLSDIWDTLQTDDGTRVSAIFDDHKPLTIVQAKDQKWVGEPFTVRLSNAPRKRDKAGTMAADLDYLLAKGFNVVLPKVRSNKFYIDELKKLAGKRFIAAVSYSWYCNPKKDVFMDDGAGNLVKMEGKAGCGVRFYLNDVGRDAATGLYPIRITCECGANIRTFGDLERFRPFVA